MVAVLLPLAWYTVLCFISLVLGWIERTDRIDTYCDAVAAGSVLLLGVDIWTKNQFPIADPSWVLVVARAWVLGWTIWRAVIVINTATKNGSNYFLIVMEFGQCMVMVCLMELFRLGR